MNGEEIKADVYGARSYSVDNSSNHNILKTVKWRVKFSLKPVQD